MAEKTKRPVGFEAWKDRVDITSMDALEGICSTEDPVKRIEKIYEGKMDGFNKFVDELIEDVGEGAQAYLREKNRRMRLEMDILDLRAELAEVEAELEKYKKKSEKKG